MIIAGSTLPITMTILDPDGTPHDLTDATVKLRYVAPDGVTGEWSATVTSAVNGTVAYTLAGASNTKTGQYAIWPFVTHLDTTTYTTGARVFEVKPEGSVGD